MSETQNTGYSFRAGLVAVAPLLVGVTPFGLAFGVAAAQSTLGSAVGFATSPIIFAGAAQFAVVQLYDAGAASIVIIATALVINARHVMYSAALSSHFAEFPRGWRVALPYLMTDQAFAVAITGFDDIDDPAEKRRYYLGAAVGLWSTWMTTTAAGVLLGAGIPASWSLDFAIPLVFLALLIPVLKGSPFLVAAAVAAVAAVAAADAPYNLGLMIGAACGIVAGIATERARR